MGRNPQEDANKKAKREMQEAVGKVIDDKKREEIGTEQAEQRVAADLSEAAQEDIGKRGRQQSDKGGSSANSGKSLKASAPRISAGSPCVTQITVVEAEPENQAEALSLMTERAHFMARQPGFISISVHRSLDGRRILNYIQWESRELLQSAHKSPEFRKEWTHFDQLTDDIDRHFYEVAHVMSSTG